MISIIGAGVTGPAWGICFARGGNEVIFYNRTHEAAYTVFDYAKSVLPELAKGGLLNGWADPQRDEVENVRRVNLPMADQPVRQHWRDRRLISLAQHKRNQGRPDAMVSDEN